MAAVSPKQLRFGMKGRVQPPVLTANIIAYFKELNKRKSQ